MATNGRDIHRNSIPVDRLREDELTDRLRTIVAGLLPGLGFPAGVRVVRPVVWRLKALAVGAGQTKKRVVAPAIPVTPVTEPTITYIIDQDVGTLTNSFYWSGDGGVTARPPVNGQYVPQAGDGLYVNTTVLGFEVLADELITVQYFTYST